MSKLKGSSNAPVLSETRRIGDLTGARVEAALGKEVGVWRWSVSGGSGMEATSPMARHFVCRVPGGATGVAGASYATGGGVPSALASSAGSQSHTAHAWRNAECANSSPAACGSGLLQTSSQSRMYSPSEASQWADPGASVASANPSGAGYA